MIRTLAVCQLRRHVRRRTHRGPESGQFVGLRLSRFEAPFLGKQFRETEVENLGLAAGIDDDVARFDVTVDDAFRMSRRQGVANLKRYREDAVEAEGFAADDFLESFPR